MAAPSLVIEFSVEKDETGIYCAHSRVGTHSLNTQGATLDELKAMIDDLLELFAENSGVSVESYRLLLRRPPLAA